MPCAQPVHAPGQWPATADILSSGAEIAHDGPILLFALEGAADVDGAALGEGDAAVTETPCHGGYRGLPFLARLFAAMR